MSSAVLDVAIIGYGPAGATLANLLGQYGLSVLVLEREAEIYPLPRAIHFDGEVMRVFETAGLRREVEAISRPGLKGMYFNNAAGETLLIRAGTQERGPHGCATNHYFHQPELEAVLRSGLQRYPQVQLRIMEGLVTRVLPGLRDGSLDFAMVADTGDVSPQEFDQKPLQQVPQRLVVRAGHPVLGQPTAARLRALEWVLPGPMALRPDEGIVQMFARAGQALPAQITHCDALAAMALVRQSDAVCVMPEPLLGQPESHGLVPLTLRTLTPPPVKLVQLSRPEVPLTPAAAYFARCLCDAMRQA